MDPSPSAAEDLIAAHGRVTRTRVAVFATLQSQGRPATHAELQEALPEPMDQVTLYRVLDWLVAKGLAERIFAGDRVARFTAASREEHPHFRCRRCGGVTCLAPDAVRSIRLPDGYEIDPGSIALGGLCGDCVGS